DGTALSVPAVNAAAAACEKGWRWEEAASLLGWMRAAGREPDLISCNSLRSACAAAALWQRALAPGARDVVSFTTMVDALPAAHWQGAVRLCADMAEQAVQPNELFLGAFGGFPTSWPLALQLLEGRALSLVVLVKVLNAAGQTQVAFRDQTSQLLQNLLRHNFDGHDFSQPLAAAEALMAFTGALQPEVLASLQSQIYWPALLQLRGLTLRPSRGGDGAFISDRVLERRFNLGPLTSAAMEQLGLEHTAPARWSAVARRSCRQGEHDEGEGEGGLNGLKPEPSAQAVLAWSSFALGSALRRRGVVTKPGPGASFFGTFGPDREDLRRLKPVFADHDRSGHAERIALLTVLTSLKLRPGAS
ncbi:MPK2, partial [Symbiodinium necroappetens]